eukprot:gene24066-30365_t
MEECYDLLSKTGERTKLDLRETVSGDTILDGVQSWPVYNIETAAKYLSDASKVRATGSTNMNSQSSRSHAICTLTVRVIYEDRSVVSKLHLVDLAGSERAKKTGATGETLQEGISINKGLLALGNVVAALVLRAKNAALVSSANITAVNVQDKENFQNGSENTMSTTNKSTNAAPAHTHIPYRESKLTRLLKDALGGNGMTVLLTCISPAESNVDETLNALRFASRVTSIVNKAKINLDTNTDNMSLLKEVNYLRKQLQDLQTKHDVVLKTNSTNLIKQPTLTQLVPVKAMDASDATAAMITVAMKLSASLKAVLILCLEEGSYIDDCEVQSMQSELDFVYSLLNIAKPVAEKKKQNAKKIKSESVIAASEENTASSTAAIPELWSLENIMSMDLSDKALLDSMMSGYCDPFAPTSTKSDATGNAFDADALDSLLLGGEGGGEGGVMGEFAPPIMRVIEDIRHLEKALKKKLAIAQDRERQSNCEDKQHKKRDRDSFNSTHSSEMAREDGDDDCDLDDMYSDSRRSSHESGANGEYFDEDEEQEVSEECAFLDRNMDFFEQQQDLAASTSTSQQQQQEPSLQERRAMQDVRKKEEDMAKLASQTAKYQRTINDLNAEIHALQQDQQKLQMRVQKAATTNKQQPSGGHASNKDSFEEIKIKRELQEKSRLLDEKVRNLKAKESELQKLSIQKTNLAKEVDGMNKTILDYKQKRVEMMKKMKSNSATFQSEKLKLKQNESSILKRENETKQNLLRLENTLTNKERVFKQQLDSKEREKGQLKELLLKQQNAKQMRDNKYVKSAVSTTINATGEKITTHSTANAAITASANTKVRDEPLTTTRSHELSAWLASEVENSALESESAEDISSEIQLRSKAVKELSALRSEKKDLLSGASGEQNTPQTLVDMDAKMCTLEDAVRSRTLSIATLQATQQQVALANSSSTKSGSRFNKLRSATESKHVNDLLFTLLNQSKSHERLLERKVAKLQDQLLKFHSQQMAEENCAAVAAQKQSAATSSKAAKASIASGGIAKNTAAFSAKLPISGKPHLFLQKKSFSVSHRPRPSLEKKLHKSSADNIGENEGDQSDSNLSENSENEDEDEEGEFSAGELDETFYVSDSELNNALSDEEEEEEEEFVRGRKRGGKRGAHRVRTSGDSEQSERQHAKGRGKRLSESSADQSGDDDAHQHKQAKHKKQKRVVLNIGSSNDDDESFHTKQNSDSEEEEDEEVHVAKETKKKRAPAAGGVKRGKRMSMEDVVIPAGLELSLEGKTLSKHTVKDLKGFLSARGLIVSGVKDELIRRLTSYMLTHPSSTEGSEIPSSPSEKSHARSEHTSSSSPKFATTPHHLNKRDRDSGVSDSRRQSTASTLSDMSASSFECNDVDRSMYMADSRGDEGETSFDLESVQSRRNSLAENNLVDNDEEEEEHVEVVEAKKKRKLFDGHQMQQSVRFDDDDEEEE